MTRRLRLRSKRCRAHRRGRVSSTATSISSCSATSSAACPGSRSIASRSDRIFKPLGMKDTMFVPPASLTLAHRADGALPRATAGRARRPDGSTMLRGVVHDPTARRMGGVAGHAGLFSTAADLAVFCAHAARRRRLSRHAPPFAARRREDDDAGDARRGAQRAIARLGHGFVFSVKPRRAAAARLVRSYRLHRARRSGSIPRPACTSFSSRTACIRMARAT